MNSLKEREKKQKYLHSRSSKQSWYVDQINDNYFSLLRTILVSYCPYSFASQALCSRHVQIWC